MASYFFACYLSSTAVQSMSIQICLIPNRVSCSVLKITTAGQQNLFGYSQMAIYKHLFHGFSYFHISQCQRKFVPGIFLLLP